MTVLSCAPLLAAGIRSVFEEGSVAILLDGLPEDSVRAISMRD